MKTTKKIKLYTQDVLIDRVFRQKRYACTRHYLYHFLCCYVMDKKSIEEMERILLLTHFELSRKHFIKVLRYKTYIYDDKIYLRYLSDLLRVMPLAKEGGGQYATYYLQGRKWNYEKTIKKYSKLNMEQLNQKIEEVLLSKEYDTEDIVFGKCESDLMRKMARIRVREYRPNPFFHYFKFLLGYIAAAATLASMFPLVRFIITSMGIDLPEYVLRLESIGIPIFAFFSEFIWIRMNLKMMRPTEYEIEHGFLEEQ